MEVKVKDKVWIMLNNMPIEIMITKVVTTISINDNDELVVESKAFAKYSETLKEDAVVNLKNAHQTKEDLMHSVFNLERQEK